MKIRFFWNNFLDEPWCAFYENDLQIRANLPGFLGDDEGLGIDHLQKWIKNGLSEIDKIKSGEIADFDMWGQSMGAVISLEKVTVYCGDDYFPEENMGFNAFYEILTRWLAYISAPIDVNREEIFFVDIEN